MIDLIRTQDQYEQVMQVIETFLKKATDAGGFDKLKPTETTELKQLTVLAEQYEDTVLKIMPLEVTLATVVDQKKDELNITQNTLALMLGMDTQKLTEILSGKRQADVPFLKAIHQKLGIDGNFILNKV